MKLNKTVGFTIIETMLFLGITALLVMGVLVGTGASINAQRYRDSVTSLQSVLQQQFSDVSNVNNDRNGNWSCGSGSHVTAETPGSGIARGQSDCVILGRYITTSDSHVITIKSVVGYIPSGSAIAKNDVDALKQYNIEVSPVTIETYDIEWGSSLVDPNSGSAMVFSMLVLRSPSSGVVRTFINSNEVVLDPEVSTLVDNSALLQSIKACVNSNGLFSGGSSAVVVMPNTTNASGIETLGEVVGC